MMDEQRAIEQLARALLESSAIRAEDLRSGEEHYTPPIKHALARASLGGDVPESLDDEEAEQIKWAVRDAEAILEGRARGGIGEAEDPSIREAVCRALRETSDDLSDALAISQELITVGAVLASAATPLAYAVIGVSLVRLGIRTVCAGV